MVNVTVRPASGSLEFDGSAGKVMIGCLAPEYKFDYYIVGSRMEIEVVQDG